MIFDRPAHPAAPSDAAHPHLAWPYRRSAVLRYGVAVLAVTIAFGIRYFVYGDLQNRVVFAFFVPAAMIAVWYGGVGPGILATVLGLVLGDIFFLQPNYRVWPLGFGVRQSLAMGAYTVTTLLCVVLCESLHNRIRRFEHALDHTRHHHQITLHAQAQAFADYLASYYARTDNREFAYPSWPYRRPLAMRYGIAIGIVILAFGLRYWLFGTQDNRFAFLFFVPAAIIAVWYGGIAPGLLATAAGLVLGDYFFLSAHEAMGAVRETERLAIGLYAVSTMLCVMLFENLHDRLRRLEHAFDRALHLHHAAHANSPLPAAAAAVPPAQ